MRLPSVARFALPRRRLALAATVCLAVGLTCAGGALLAHADSSTGITVTGQGSATLPPDQAEINGSVQTQAATASDALSQNGQAAQAVVAAAKAFLDGNGSVQTTGLNVYPQYAPPPQPIQAGQPIQPSPTPGPPQIVGYQATTSIDVKTTKLDSLGDLVQALVNAGLTNFYGVSFSLQNPEQLRTEALQAAIDDAQAQAQAAADRLGVTLGPVVNVQIGYSNTGPVPYGSAFPAPPPPVKAATAAAQAPPVIAPGPLTATSSVTVTYSIVPAQQ